MRRPGAATRGYSSRRKAAQFRLDYGLDVIVAECLADGAAVLVVDHAARLVEHFPAALPGHIAEVGVFQVEGREQLVEAAELEELAPVEGARTAAAVKAGEQPGRRPRPTRWRTRSAPSCHQPWVRPVSSRAFAGSLKKIWQETAKTAGSAKPSSSGARKSGVHAHVVIEQNHDVVPGGAEARVRAAAEAEVPLAGPPV